MIRMTLIWSFEWSRVNKTITIHVEILLDFDYQLALKDLILKKRLSVSLGSNT